MSDVADETYDHRAWINAQIEEAMARLERGELVLTPHAEVVARFKAKLLERNADDAFCK